MSPSFELSDRFASRLIDWYHANKRDLPWRRLEDEPYAVLVSEVMLQQTQVRTVVPYFERWMERFPTIQALADSPLEDVLRVWAGLGYYARARNLHLAAQHIVTRFGGRIPSDQSDLSDLPGVGRYTLGAVLSIGFNKPAPIVDANVARVLSRIYALDGDPKSAGNQKSLWRLAGELMPAGEARDFNQALMELGALVCSPSDPACERCPILPHCIAGNSPDPTVWPQMPPGKRTVRVSHASAVILQGTEVLLIRRPPHGLWGGLWELPRRVCEPGESPAACAERAAREVVGVCGRAMDSVGIVKHNVTHHAISLHGILVEAESLAATTLDCTDVAWVSLAKRISLPLSAPQHLLLSALVEQLGIGLESDRSCFVS